ncbi:phosphonatase-like hydrolase [Gordonia amicalis]|uniref:Phosphonatase-like hydrolase n=1 Tax=Gordonia amicalis TaxID=89053 RepID=A0AAE4U0R3_9ACTN|nr:phosphonatase-like hydrolase [Gordonia amicalis]MCZ4579395.1 phosphonatase-like hydrolase [Gordonia amicalis]MDV6312154.1 phosphonatase-like hydrolase [Gordonia amicalis]
MRMQTSGSIRTPNSEVTDSTVPQYITGPVQLVVFDMAGTTVVDDGLVTQAFEAAATAVGVPEAGETRERARKYVLDTMGQSKIAVFRALFGAEGAAETANEEFERAYGELITRGVEPVAGASEVLAGLRARGIATAFTTGFSPATQQRILRTLGWTEAVDHVLAPTAGLRGRPYPDLVLAAALTAQVDDLANVIVVGDTSSDIETARRARVGLSVGVLTGAHDEATLRAAGADAVLASVADLPALIPDS